MAIDTLAIDLDDTLFSEINYVYSGYNEVARAIYDANGIPVEYVYGQLTYQFLKYGRTGVFDRVMLYFGISNSNIESIIDVYRNHSPNISLYSGVDVLLDKLSKNFKIAIVTDGTHKVQRNKIDALRLSDMVDKVIYCDEHSAPKPSTLSLGIVTKELETKPEKILFIGDDPYCDIKMATDANIKSYRVRTGKYKSVECIVSKPNAEFSTFVAAAEHILEYGIDE